MIIRARYEAGAFRPYRRGDCDEALTDGEMVTLEVTRDRSMRSHRHQFAEIKQAWLNLPESEHQQPYAANAETLRKHALICTGWCDVEAIIAGSDPERTQAYLSRLAVRAHGYAVTKLNGDVVLCWTPQSQSVKAMGRENFQRSKDDVLTWCARLLGVKAEELRSAA